MHPLSHPPLITSYQLCWLCCRNAPPEPHPINHIVLSLMLGVCLAGMHPLPLITSSYQLLLSVVLAAHVLQDFPSEPPSIKHIFFFQADQLCWLCESCRNAPPEPPSIKHIYFFQDPYEVGVCGNTEARLICMHISFQHALRGVDSVPRSLIQ
jgi:hypothetical protein